VAPVLPGLSDGEDQLRQVVEACAAAGAVSVTGVALHLRGTVRGHYLDWLESQRPDLVGLHRVRFRRGGYQPDEERDRIQGVVREAALRCGVNGRDRFRGVRSRSTGHHPAATPAPKENPEHGGEQLSLL
jgi:DNA repair photolyase